MAEANTRGKWMALLAAFLGWMFDGLEIGLFPLAGRPAMTELIGAVGPDTDRLIGQWMSGVVAAFLLGAAVGGTVFGWLGDRVGRVRAMVFSVLTYSLFSGACAFVQSPVQLAALRFVASMGMGGEWALGVALVSEIWPAKNRPLLSGLIGAAANMGFMIVGFVGLGASRFVAGLGKALAFLPLTWTEMLLRNGGWRLIFLVGALPAVLTFVIRIFVPESEKWKAATRDGRKSSIIHIFEGEIAASTYLGACLAGVALLGTWGAVQFIPSWVQQFTGSQQKASWTLIFQAVGASTIPIVVALLAQKFNRRGTYAWLCIGSFVLCQALFLLYRKEPQFGFRFLLLATLVNGVTAGFYGWLPLYLPELFPTRIRATGAGFTFNAGRVIAATGTFLASGGLMSVFGSYALMGSIMCSVYLVGTIVVFFCPETKGKPLPE
ncbi:MAG TPA: MFS transporter [Planctomycetota bacterium]|nr:MFS transporter [Planctomycetota bacterium]